MHTPVDQHLIEIEKNQSSWSAKPLLQHIYAEFYREITAQIDATIPGRIVEVGSGIGNLKLFVPTAICTDLFLNLWLDLSCDAYALPFRNGTISHLIIFDVFHHLARPYAFFAEARRVLSEKGRLIIFEPYVSLASAPAYGLFHHEPIGWRKRIDSSENRPVVQEYYAAQGNATRIFFSGAHPELGGLRVLCKRVYCSFAYLLSGGFSKPALYGRDLLPLIARVDRALSRFPKIFGARCLVVMRRS